MDPIARENEYVGTMKRNKNIVKDANQNETVHGNETIKKKKMKRQKENEK